MKKGILFALILIGYGFVYAQEFNTTTLLATKTDSNGVTVSKEFKIDCTIFVDSSLGFVGLMDNEFVNEPIVVVDYFFIETGADDEIIFQIDYGYIAFFSDKVVTETYDPETKIKEILVYK